MRRLCSGLGPTDVPTALREEVWAIRDDAAEAAVAGDCTAALNAGRIGGWGVGRLQAAPSGVATALVSVATATCEEMGLRTPLSALLADAVRAMGVVRGHAAAGHWGAAAAAAAALLQKHGADLRATAPQTVPPRPAADAAIAATAAECVLVVWSHRHAQIARHVREALTGGGAAGGRVGALTTAGVVTAPLAAAAGRLEAATAGLDASLARRSDGSAPSPCGAYDPAGPVELGLVDGGSAAGVTAPQPPGRIVPRTPELARLARTAAEVLVLRRALVARDWSTAAEIVGRCAIRVVDASGGVALLPLASQAAALLAAQVSQCATRVAL